MTQQNKIEPERITKPMQLLAAWLVGLIIVDGSFLVAAVQMGADSWERRALVIAAVVNVPLFLAAMFLLQTKFRPELQEDSYYSQYLDKRTNKVVTVRRDELIEKEIGSIRSELRLLTSQAITSSPRGLQAGAGEWRWKVGLNRRLADFDKLRDKLRDLNVPLDDIFGTDAAPEVRAVAVAQYLPFEDKVRTLRMAQEMGFTSYTYFDPPEEEIEQDILFGSYGDPAFRITPHLAAVLDSSPEPADLRLYEQRNPVRRG